MDLETYSRKYIKKYLEKYNIVLQKTDKINKQKDIIVGDLKLSTAKDDKLGHLHYVIDEITNDLHVDWIYIKKSKPELSVKLSKVLFLYLLASYSHFIKTITLTSSAGIDPTKAGTEYCLPCFYQKLGFEPVDHKMVDRCLKKLKKINTEYEKLTSMCILCECQKYKLDFTKVDLSDLHVDMKALLPNLVKMLKDSYREIKNDLKY